MESGLRRVQQGTGRRGNSGLRQRCEWVGSRVSVQLCSLSFLLLLRVAFVAAAAVAIAAKAKKRSSISAVRSSHPALRASFLRSVDQS